MQPKEFSGLAVDKNTEKNTLDIYAFFVNSELTKSLESYYLGQLEAPTGAAVVEWPFTSSQDRYTLELSINKKAEVLDMIKLPTKFNMAKKIKNRLKSSPEFSDLYGPYELTKNQTFIFAQQLEYNPKIYNGDYTIIATVFRENIALIKSELEINME